MNLNVRNDIRWRFILSKKERLSMETIRSTGGKECLLFFVTLLGLSPILKTLTSQTSDDTIWALTVCCFIANVLFHDYNTEVNSVK